MQKLLSFIVFIGLFVALFLGLNWAIGGVFDAVDEEKAEKSVLVGEDVVINGDTLVVVDYKILNEKYVLSNGVEISEDYANSLVEPND